jgi:hypothetical protein
LAETINKMLSTTTSSERINAEYQAGRISRSSATLGAELARLEMFVRIGRNRELVIGRSELVEGIETFPLPIVSDLEQAETRIMGIRAGVQHLRDNGQLPESFTSAYNAKRKYYRNDAGGL